MLNPLPLIIISGFAALISLGSALAAIYLKQRKKSGLPEESLDSLKNKLPSIQTASNSADEEESYSTINLLKACLEKYPKNSNDYITAQKQLGEIYADRYNRINDSQDFWKSVNAYIAFLNSGVDNYEKLLNSILPEIRLALADSLIRMQETEKASMLLKSIKENQSEYAKSLYDLGVVHENQQEFLIARSYMTDSLRQYESLGDQYNIAKVYLSIGHILYEQRNNEKALKYLERSKNIFQSLKKRSELSEAENLYEEISKKQSLVNS